MKYTPEELGKLHELTINTLIAKALNRDYVVSNLNSDDYYLLCEDTDEEINYCQTPDDIMPIASESKINTCWNNRENIWQADIAVTDRYIFSNNENRLRGICEVFILMNQGAES